MDVIDKAKKELIEQKEFFKNEELKAKNEKDVISAKVKKITSRLSELSEKRKNIAVNIEAKTLTRYERVLKNRDGLGMVRVTGGACGGCHMNLPPQVISDIRLKEDIIICSSCSRILYIDDDVEIN